MQRERTMTPVLNEKLCSFWTIRFRRVMKKFFMDFSLAKKYFFFLHYQGIILKKQKKVCVNE